MIENLLTRAKNRERLVFFAGLFVLVAICAVVYFPTLHYPFQYDDIPAIVDNPGIRIPGWGLDSLKGIILNAPRADRRPIAQLSFALNYRVSGFDTMSWHVFNLSIHLLNMILLGVLSRKLYRIVGMSEMRSSLAAFLSAGAWGLHPINTQAVTYIVQRMASMMALFALVSILFFLMFREQQTGRIKGYIYAFSSGVFFLLAMGTKENAIVLPLIIIVVELFVLGGWSGLHSVNKRKKIAFATVGILYLIAGSWVYFGGHFHVLSFADRSFSMWERLLTEPRMIMRYFSILILPLPSKMTIDLAPAISVGFFQPATTFPAIVALLSVLCYAIVAGQRRSLFSLATFWFFISTSVESTIIPLDLYFEHRMYFPSMLIFTWLIGNLIKGEGNDGAGDESGSLVTVNDR